jgi:hypothetical protein
MRGGLSPGSTPGVRRGASPAMRTHEPVHVTSVVNTRLRRRSFCCKGGIRVPDGTKFLVPWKFTTDFF